MGVTHGSSSRVLFALAALSGLEIRAEHAQSAFPAVRERHGFHYVGLSNLEWVTQAVYPVRLIMLVFVQKEFKK